MSFAFSGFWTGYLSKKIYHQIYSRSGRVQGHFFVILFELKYNGGDKMVNLIIVIISVLIPIGLILFYYFINRSLENNDSSDNKTGSENKADKKK